MCTYMYRYIYIYTYIYIYIERERERERSIHMHTVVAAPDEAGDDDEQRDPGLNIVVYRRS